MRKIPVVITCVMALAALVAPTSSIAKISPPGAKFEVVGDTSGPKLTTSLGSCSIARITGQIPEKEPTAPFPISTPTAGSCSTGASITISGEWRFRGSGYSVQMFGMSSTPIVLRYSSLPNCSLTVAYLRGIWSNGVGAAFKSGFHAQTVLPALWGNDGGPCAVAGSKEPVSFEDMEPDGSGATGGVSVVNDLTYPATPIVVTP